MVISSEEGVGLAGHFALWRVAARRAGLGASSVLDSAQVGLPLLSLSSHSFIALSNPVSSRSC